ncbi:porin family protein [Flagellimonas sp. S3867]|uniref:porin family protein n=1 Tax=Flagellimonas sp. S3867 TaxID=2768063 RepID=UPI001683883B|nr:porin family protein [Flagellimonas sp. S3867]
MKISKILLITTCLLFGVNIYGQNNVTFGIKAGYQRAGFINSNSTFLDNNRFQVGGLVEWEQTPFFALQGELLFERKGGFLVLFPNSRFRTKIDTKLDYISLPVLGKLALVKGVALEAGPQLGFLIGDSGKVVSDGSDFELPDTNFIELSVNAGFRFTVLQHYFMQIRGNLGLTQVFDGLEDSDHKNVALKVSLGYMF